MAQLKPIEHLLPNEHPWDRLTVNLKRFVGVACGMIDEIKTCMEKPEFHSDMEIAVMKLDGFMSALDELLEGDYILKEVKKKRKKKYSTKELEKVIAEWSGVFFKDCICEKKIADKNLAQKIRGLI